jgi:predicted O-methyltransferase YrrM
VKKLFKAASYKPNNDFVREVMEQLTDDPVWTLDILEIVNNREPDIRTLLSYLANKFEPKNYLEIGVRRGFSMAMVAARCPECDIYGFDLWKANYAGVPNPGPEFVEQEIKRFNHTSKLALISGDTAITLEAFFDDNPDLEFDLMLVDKEGPLNDLRLCLPRLAKGGYLVTDDLNMPEQAHTWDTIKKEFAKGYTYHAEGRVGLVKRGK